MTIGEAVRKGIGKLRRDPWSPGNYVELHLIRDKDGGLYYGPWAKVHDPLIDAGESTPSPPVLTWLLPGDDAWEEYFGTRRLPTGQLVNLSEEES